MVSCSLVYHLNHTNLSNTGTYNPSLASVTCMDVSSSERIAAFGSTDGGTFLCSVTTDQQKATDLYVNEARWIASVPSRNPIVSPCYISVSNEEPASSVSFLPCMSAKDRENASKSLFSSNIPVETMSKPLLVTPAKRLASVRTSLLILQLHGVSFILEF